MSTLFWLIAGVTLATAQTPTDLQIYAQLVEPEGRGLTNGVRVVVTAPRAFSYTLDEPDEVAGLEISEARASREAIGPNDVLTATWVFTGKPGRYVIPSLCARPQTGSPACAAPLYVHLGNAPDRSELVDLHEPEPVGSWGDVVPWWSLAALPLVLAAGLLVWTRRTVPEAEGPVEERPLHQQILEAWADTRADTALTREQKAFVLSELFRRYLDGMLAFPAMAWSTRETLAHLKTLPALPDPHVQRARRLLRATDLVKYAERRPDGDFFDGLHDDLTTFIDATRPRHWDGDDQETS